MENNWGFVARRIPHLVVGGEAVSAAIVSRGVAMLMDKDIVSGVAREMAEHALFGMHDGSGN